MLERVTYHACIRYLERVLGLPVDAWLIGREHWPENLRAQHCCERAGLPVDAVKAAILCEPVMRALRSGVTTALKHDGFVYLLRAGVVCTVQTRAIYLNTMSSRYGPPRFDKSKKRRKEKRRLEMAGVE
jgi:hypothetical protein